MPTGIPEACLALARISWSFYSCLPWLMSLSGIKGKIKQVSIFLMTSQQIETI